MDVQPIDNWLKKEEVGQALAQLSGAAVPSSWWVPAITLSQLRDSIE